MLLFLDLSFVTEGRPNKLFRNFFFFNFLLLKFAFSQFDQGFAEETTKNTFSASMW